MVKYVKCFLLIFCLSRSLVTHTMEERFVDCNSDIERFFKTEYGKYQCGDCGKLIIRPGMFRYHMDIVHNKKMQPPKVGIDVSLYETRDGQYFCAYCQQKFIRPGNFKNHMEDQHDEIIEIPKRKWIRARSMQYKKRNYSSDALLGLECNAAQSMEPAQKRMKIIEYNESSSFFDWYDREQRAAQDTVSDLTIQDHNSLEYLTENLLGQEYQEIIFENAEQAAEEQDFSFDAESFVNACLSNPQEKESSRKEYQCQQCNKSYDHND